MPINLKFKKRDLEGYLFSSTKCGLETSMTDVVITCDSAGKLIGLKFDPDDEEYIEDRIDIAEHGGKLLFKASNAHAISDNYRDMISMTIDPNLARELVEEYLHYEQ